VEEFFSIERTEDISVIRLSFNEINLEQREELKKDFLDVIASGARKFVIDFSRVGFLSSLVMATIVFFAKEVGKNNGVVKLSGLSREARSVFQLAQLDKVFELYDTEHDAVESLKTSL
jgi:anti-anti-sigma factor